MFHSTALGQALPCAVSLFSWPELGLAAASLVFTRQSSTAKPMLILTERNICSYPAKFPRQRFPRSQRGQRVAFYGGGHSLQQLPIVIWADRALIRLHRRVMPQSNGRQSVLPGICLLNAGARPLAVSVYRPERRKAANKVNAPQGGRHGSAMQR